MPFKKKDKVPVVCVECGNTFFVSPYREKTAKFCCKEHKYNYIRRTMKAKHARKVKPRKYVLVCENVFCQKEFIVNSYDYYRRQYCSQNCYHYCRSGKYKTHLENKEERDDRKRRNDIWKL